jgi:hypothetical protein
MARKTEFDDALKGRYRDNTDVQQEQTTDYRSLTAESVGSLILGVLSALTFLHWSLAIFPIMGIILGVAALRKILNASEELSGFEISTAGVALCVVFWIAGYGWLYYSYSYAIPSGYIPLSFNEIKADPKTGKLPDYIVQYAEEGQKVFLVGHMYPGRKMTGIESFMLVPTLDHCKFCTPTRNPTEMIDVQMVNGLTASFRTRQVRVGGIFSINPDYIAGELPYRIDADVFR